ncbi:rCG62283, partial [Rattus norvegicus]
MEVNIFKSENNVGNLKYFPLLLS